jgi:hypothetical protein
MSYDMAALTLHDPSILSTLAYVRADITVGISKPGQVATALYNGYLAAVHMNNGKYTIECTRVSSVNTNMTLAVHRNINDILMYMKSSAIDSAEYVERSLIDACKQ